MPGQEGEGEGSEEEIKDSLLRQWKEGRLQVAEEKGRQIPTIIERRSLPKRQSWPPLLSSQPPAALLPDLSQPPPGFQHLQPGQHSLPLPAPSSLASSITATTTQQASPGGQYREQVLKALLAGTKLGEVVDALLAVPAATLGKSSTVFEGEPVPMSMELEGTMDKRTPLKRARKKDDDGSEGEIILMRESDNEQGHHIIRKSGGKSLRGDLDPPERLRRGKHCDRSPSPKSHLRHPGYQRYRSKSRSNQSHQKYQRSNPHKNYNRKRSESRSSRKSSNRSLEGKLKDGSREDWSRSGRNTRKSKQREYSRHDSDNRRSRSGKRKKARKSESEHQPERVIGRHVKTEKDSKKNMLSFAGKVGKHEKGKVSSHPFSPGDLRNNGGPSTREKEREIGATTAVVRHLIDSQSGLLELFEGGERKAVLFHAEQVHLDQEVQDQGKQIHEALRPGLKVMVVVQPVESKIVPLQAVALWLSGCRVPSIPKDIIFNFNFTLKVKLQEQLNHFLDWSHKNVLPLCIDGLPTGEHHKCSAKVKKLVDDEWGLVEVKVVQRQGKLRCFLCLFHKSDVWLSNGVRVPNQRYFKHRSLGEIVAINQPVTLAARSILKEKGTSMMGMMDASVEMQALWVALNPSSFPQGVSRAVRIEKGPGSLAGSRWTPCMFEAGLQDRLGKRLRQYVMTTGKTLRGIDPDLKR